MRTFQLVLALATVASTTACSLDAASLLQATAGLKPQQGAQAAPVGVNGQPAPQQGNQQPGNQQPGMQQPSNQQPMGQPDCMPGRKVAQVGAPAPKPGAPAPNTNPGGVNPGPNNPGPVNPGPNNPGPNNPGPNNPGPNNPGPNNPGPINAGPNNPGNQGLVTVGPMNPAPNGQGANPCAPQAGQPNQPQPGGNQPQPGANQPQPQPPAGQPNPGQPIQPKPMFSPVPVMLSPTGEPLESILDAKVPVDSVLNLQVLDDTFVFAGRGTVTIKFKGTGTHLGGGIGKTYMGVYDAGRTSDPSTGGSRLVGAIGGLPTFSTLLEGSVAIDTSHLVAGSYWLRATTLVSTGRWEIAEGVLMVH
ncbi:MAG: hypothetical protein JWM80_5497 [Cyanobacteria bacterium RYN_339]|nr:hypothetical protein [Cyanobacteria bacterium RYN_339]